MSVSAAYASDLANSDPVPAAVEVTAAPAQGVPVTGVARVVSLAVPPSIDEPVTAILAGALRHPDLKSLEFWLKASSIGQRVLECLPYLVNEKRRHMLVCRVADAEAIVRVIREFITPKHIRPSCAVAVDGIPTGVSSADVLELLTLWCPELALTVLAMHVHSLAAPAGDGIVCQYAIIKTETLSVAAHCDLMRKSNAGPLFAYPIELLGTRWALPPRRWTFASAWPPQGSVPQQPPVEGTACCGSDDDSTLPVARVLADSVVGCRAVTCNDNEASDTTCSVPASAHAPAVVVAPPAAATPAVQEGAFTVTISGLLVSTKAPDVRSAASAFSSFTGFKWDGPTRAILAFASEADAAALRAAGILAVGTVSPVVAVVDGATVAPVPAPTPVPTSAHALASAPRPSPASTAAAADCPTAAPAAARADVLPPVVSATEGAVIATISPGVTAVSFGTEDLITAVTADARHRVKTKITLKSFLSTAKCCAMVLDCLPQPDKKFYRSVVVCRVADRSTILDALAAEWNPAEVKKLNIDHIAPTDTAADIKDLLLKHFPAAKAKQARTANRTSVVTNQGCYYAQTSFPLDKCDAVAAGLNGLRRPGAASPMYVYPHVLMGTKWEVPQAAAPDAATASPASRKSSGVAQSPQGLVPSLPPLQDTAARCDDLDNDAVSTVARVPADSVVAGRAATSDDVEVDTTHRVPADTASAASAGPACAPTGTPAAAVITPPVQAPPAVGPIAVVITNAIRHSDQRPIEPWLRDSSIRRRVLDCLPHPELPARRVLVCRRADLRAILDDTKEFESTSSRTVAIDGIPADASPARVIVLLSAQSPTVAGKALQMQALHAHSIVSRTEDSPIRCQYATIKTACGADAAAALREFNKETTGVFAYPAELAGTRWALSPKSWVRLHLQTPTHADSVAAGCSDHDSDTAHCVPAGVAGAADSASPACAPTGTPASAIAPPLQAPVAINGPIAAMITNAIRPLDQRPIEPWLRGSSICARVLDCLPHPERPSRRVLVCRRADVLAVLDATRVFESTPSRTVAIDGIAADASPAQVIELLSAQCPTVARDALRLQALHTHSIFSPTGDTTVVQCQRATIKTVGGAGEAAALCDAFNKEATCLFAYPTELAGTRWALPPKNWVPSSPPNPPHEEASSSASPRAAAAAGCVPESIPRCVLLSKESAGQPCAPASTASAQPTEATVAGAVNAELRVAATQRVAWDSFPVLSVLRRTTVAAQDVSSATAPLEVVDVLRTLRPGLVLDVGLPGLAAAFSGDATATPSTTSGPQRLVIVCSGVAARRVLMRALDAFEPRTGERLVVEGLPRGTTADDMTQLLRRLCADVRPIDVSVAADVAPGTGVGCTAVITCCRLSGDIDSVVTALHGKRLGGSPQPLCVYPLELQHTEWAPNPYNL